MRIFNSHVLIVFLVAFVSIATNNIEDTKCATFCEADENGELICSQKCP